jgi:hypothetical protein
MRTVQFTATACLAAFGLAYLVSSSSLSWPFRAKASGAFATVAGDRVKALLSLVKCGYLVFDPVFLLGL